MTEAEQIMKRCQAGTRNYEEANNLHAACYGIIGKLLAQRKPLTDLSVSELWPGHGYHDSSKWHVFNFARKIEAAHDIRENT
jgi:hypothetical protein